MSMPKDKVALTGDRDIDEVLELLQKARDYQDAWLTHGVNRVYPYFDDIDGDWLEKWGEDDDD